MQQKKSGCSPFSLFVFVLAAGILLVCFVYPNSPFNPFNAPKHPAAGHGNPKAVSLREVKDMNFHDLEQLYGPLYAFSDHKRGEHVAYRRYDGTIASGTIIWIQEPGEAIGRTGKHLQMKAQYIIEPDSDTGMVDFVNLGDVQE